MCVEKSRLNKNLYNSTILENGIRLLCISTNNEPKLQQSRNNVEHMELHTPLNKSCAALCINSGSFSDPEEAPGLSHFLEHMILMGSEKFPEENNFPSYVTHRGGHYDACTSQERTLFAFDVHKTYFADCLDRFANYFISPRMNKDMIEQELSAIENEYQLAASDDMNRLQHFVGSIAKAGSPFRKFVFGNRESLDDIPRLKSIDTYSLLWNHWRTHYSADRMTLVLQSDDPIENLQHLAKQYFKTIPRRARFPMNFQQYANAFDTTSFRKFYQICPVQNTEQVQIIWVFPSLLDEYESCPTKILADLFNETGKGSINAILRSMNCATQVCALSDMTSAFQHSSVCTIFTVYVQLTELGSSNVLQVCGIIFNYIRNICAAAKLSLTINKAKPSVISTRQSDSKTSTFSSYVSEKARLSEAKFFYGNSKRNSDDCGNLAEMMHMVPTNFVLSAGVLIKKQNIQLYYNLLRMMSPENACILHTSPSFIKKLNTIPRTQKEHWFDIHYVALDMDPAVLRQWKNPDTLDALHLPQTNMFIPKNFEILDTDGDMSHPVNINLDSGGINRLRYGSLWFCQATRFHLPLAHFAMHFWSPQMCDSMKSFLLLELLTLLLSNTLSNGCRDAETVGMKVQASSLMNGIILEVSGYSDQIFPTYSKALAVILGPLHLISGSQFMQFRQSLYDYFEKRLRDHTAICQDMCKFLTERKAYLPSELLSTLENLSVADVVAFKQRIFCKQHLTAFAFGNISKKDSIRLFEHTVDEIAAAPLKSRYYNDVLVYAPGIYQLKFENSQMPTKLLLCIQLHLLGRTKLEDKILSMLLIILLAKHVDDFFCNKQMIASQASLRQWIQSCDGNCHRGLTLELLSDQPSTSSSTLLGRMDIFWYYIAPRILASLPNEVFNRSIAALVQYLSVNDQSMQQAYDQAFRTIFMEENIDFDENAKCHEYLRHITQDYVVQYFIENYMDSHTKTHFNISFESPSDDSVRGISIANGIKHLNQDEATLQLQNEHRKNINLPNVLRQLGVRNSKALNRMRKCQSANWLDDYLEQSFHAILAINDAEILRRNAQCERVTDV